MTMFAGDDLKEAMGVPFFYGACEALFVGLYCIIAWKMGWTKAPADASFWRVIVTSYEVLEAEFNQEMMTEIEIAISSDSTDTPNSHKSDVESQTGHVLTTYFELGRIPDPIPAIPKEPSGLENPRAKTPEPSTTPANPLDSGNALS